MDKLLVIGHLGQDPESRYSPSGEFVCTFSLADNHTYYKAGERVEECQWFNCAAWGKLGETCHEHLVKGAQVYVEGRVRTRSYQGRDGRQQFVNDLLVSRVQFLDRAASLRPEVGVGGVQDDREQAEEREAA